MRNIEKSDEMHNGCAIFAPDGTYQQSDQIAGTFRPVVHFIKEYRSNVRLVWIQNAHG